MKASKTIAQPVEALPTKAGDAEAIKRLFQQRVVADSELQPKNLKAALDDLDRGDLRRAAKLFDRITTRNPVVGSVVAKRVKDVSRMDWGVFINDEVDDSEKAAAEKHQEALEDFYRHIEVTQLLAQDIRGGFRHLVRQMAGAIGSLYAVHEVTWLPAAGTRPFTAHLTLWPLWMFEAREGYLRWLDNPNGYTGQPMLPGEWLVATGDGLMRATVGLVAIRDMSLGDWAAYSERFGMPFILGKTAAAKGTPEWNAVKDMVQSFMGDGCGVVNMDAAVELITTGGAAGSATHQPLTEYCDGWITALWRGGNLSTQSKQDNQGSSLQGKETEILREDDAAEITGVLNRTLDRQVIAYLFGPGVEPLAHVRICPPVKSDTTANLAVDQFLSSIGIALDRHELLERYDRTEAANPEDAIQPPAAASGSGSPALSPTGSPAADVTAANSAETSTPAETIAPALDRYFAPLRSRLAAIADLPEADMVPALEDLQKTLAAQLVADGIAPDAVAALQESLLREFVNGYGRMARRSDLPPN